MAVPHPSALLPQVSWLQLWLLLLGTEDFASEEQLLSQRTHRRPTEADMAQASAELAGVAADVEVSGDEGSVGAAHWCCCFGGWAVNIAVTPACYPALTPQALGGGGLTAASLATPAGEALVARCQRLHERLTALSQLEPPEGSPLVPLVRRSVMC